MCYIIKYRQIDYAFISNKYLITKCVAVILVQNVSWNIPMAFNCRTNGNENGGRQVGEYGREI